MSDLLAAFTHRTPCLLCFTALLYEPAALSYPILSLGKLVLLLIIDPSHGFCRSVFIHTGSRPLYL